MKIFGIGDLHLPGRQDKPMNVFGAQWTDHPDRIAAQWRRIVGEGDLVLMPGDLSWAMTLNEAADDLAYLGALPGRIVLIRGNHDYWWEGIGKVRQALPPNVVALQNDFVPLGEGWAICGTRGWDLPGAEGHSEVDDRVFRRELIRLELSLQAAVKQGLKPFAVMLHYPPAWRSGMPTAFTQLLEKHGVQLCVYGHLHGDGIHKGIVGEHRGVTYRLVSCDAIGFAPRLVGRVVRGVPEPAK